MSEEDAERRLSALTQDENYRALMSWKPYDENWTSHIQRGANVLLVPGTTESIEPLTQKEVETLRGAVVIIEGGVGQGKTKLVQALKTAIEALGVGCYAGAEPVDLRALRLFIAFQKIPEEATGKELELRREAKKVASEMMQFTMMRNRTENARKAAEASRRGDVALLDRGPFGDSAFMCTTFAQAGVPMKELMQYVIEFQRRYMELGLTMGSVVIVRLCAPAAITLPRWLDREKAEAGNKYTMEYVQSLETAHDWCSEAWGQHIVYDNTRTPSPNGDSSDCEEYARSLNAVLRAISKMRANKAK